MVYNDTPIPTDTPATSQPQMRQNFQTLSNFWTPDHIPLSSGANVGFSNKLTLVTQVAAPTSSATPAGGVEYVFVPTNYATTHSELFYRGEAGTGSIQQVTNQSLTASSGQGMMPGGLQVRAGFIAINIPGGTALNFTPKFPTACVSVVLTGQNAVDFPRVISIAAGGASATVGTSGGPINAFYIAIGY